MRPSCYWPITWSPGGRPAGSRTAKKPPTGVLRFPAAARPGASGWSGPGQFLALFAYAGEEGEDFSGGGSLAGGLGQRQVRLDLVAVAAAVLSLTA